ncbi:MAG TPA: TetR/AcrR family transcriptional regulator [Cyclobacteriaceae bacterium]|nr:TetR/AcrR family transcriptional regulator [Flammeovirgaceae bacterium]MCW5902407.1 TetR/AcrR family transcriptional regulator [Cyclobacteriaceae bacterium]HOO09176.1 TetR/AcrR family transcriptional regulator [Cyclobacteriaceae bacterium]HPI79834.1 TetR/AcrR family transcriptional regulator [Cyclobacteriaceae bacterium]
MEMRLRQLEIIEAAGEILTQAGLAGLTTKKLAARIGFSESALYRHFKGKEEIVITMLKYLAREMDERIDKTISPIENPQEKLKALFNSQFAFFKQNPHFLIAIFSDGLLEASKEINKAISSIMAITKKHLMQVIQEGQKQKLFTRELPADDQVHIIMGSFRLHMLQWRMSGYAFDLKVKGNKLMNNLFALLAPN